MYYKELDTVLSKLKIRDLKKIQKNMHEVIEWEIKIKDNSIFKKYFIYGRITETEKILDKFKKYNDMEIAFIILGSVSSHIYNKKKPKKKSFIRVTNPNDVISGGKSQTLLTLEYLIKNATSSLYLIGYTFSFNIILPLIREAINRNVQIKIIGEENSFVKSMKKKLKVDTNIDFYYFDKTSLIYDLNRRDYEKILFHAKVCTKDDDEGLITSANFSHNGMKYSIEIGTRIEGDDVKEIKRFITNLIDESLLIKVKKYQ